MPGMPSGLNHSLESHACGRKRTPLRASSSWSLATMSSSHVPAIFKPRSQKRTSRSSSSRNFAQRGWERFGLFFALNVVRQFTSPHRHVPRAFSQFEKKRTNKPLLSLTLRSERAKTRSAHHEDVCTRMRTHTCKTRNAHKRALTCVWRTLRVFCATARFLSN